MPPQRDFKLGCPSGCIQLRNVLEGNDSDWVVWWYAGIYRNPLDASQPHCRVVFRKKDSNDWSPNAAIVRRVPLTWLGQLRIGTVWRESKCRSELAFDVNRFDVDFTKGKWKLTSFYETVSAKAPPPYPEAQYPLPYPKDRAWFLEFPVKTGGKLLIPCIEFFSRIYGRSAEAKRILATYSWDGVQDSAKGRLYAPVDEPEEPGIWKVKLGDRLVNDDAVFVAQVKYDQYTEHAAKDIYAQIESQYNADPKKATFLKATPWFQGEAEIWVKGIWFDHKRSFLALQILGCSNPDGPPIQRFHDDAEEEGNPGDGDLAAEDQGGGRRVVPNNIELTGDAAPDRGAVTGEVHDPDFIVLGKPRVVIDIRKPRINSGSGGSRKSGITATSTFSAGDPHGAGKGVGRALIHAKQVLESHGMLRDMWNALLYLAKKRPGQISSVEWFTFDAGFNKNAEPELIALQPFGKGDKVKTSVRNWLYLDPVKQTPRGILIAKVIAAGKAVYILEIQRRPRAKLDDAGNKLETEESFSGLVFALNDQEKFELVLRETLEQIRQAKGIIKDVIARCLGLLAQGKAADFKHSTANSDKVPAEAAVINALGKVGVR